MGGIDGQGHAREKEAPEAAAHAEVPSEKKDFTLPQVRPDLEVSEQRQAGERVYIVKDPVALRYYRLGDMEYEVFRLLKERMTFSRLKATMEERFGLEFPDDTLLRLLGMMRRSDFFVARGLSDYKYLFEMKRVRRRAQMKGWLYGFLYLRVPLIDPDRFLNRTIRLVKFFFTPWFLLLWGVLGILALWMVASAGFGNLRSDLSRLGGWNMLLFLVSIAAVKSLHELAHAYTCKHFGGEVHELGLMLLVLQPVFYTNVTDAWFFPTRRQRLWVTAAGIFFELFIAYIAVIVWKYTDPGLLHNFAFSTMVTCSVSTVVFNANPLLRYDGYYLLSDWLEIPNLRARCFRYISYLVRRYAVGKKVEFPVSTARERIIYVSYGISSFLYRTMVIVGIIFLLMRKLPGVGIALAVFYVLMQFLVPLGKAVARLVQGRRDLPMLKRLAATTGILAALFLLLYMAPWRVKVRSVGVVLPARRTVLRAGTDGFVAEVLVREGEHVEAGEVVARLENRELEARRRVLEGKVRILDKRIAKVTGIDEAARRILLAQRQGLEEELEGLDEKLNRLEIRSPREGRVARLEGAPYSRRRIEEWVGVFLREGDALMEVLSEEGVVIGSIVPEGRIAAVEEGSALFFLAEAYPAKVFRGIVEKIAPTKLEEIDVKALTLGAGGKIATRPTVTGKERPLKPYFLVTGRMENLNGLLKVGMTGKVKISGPRTTLLGMAFEKVAGWIRAKWRRVF